MDKHRISVTATLIAIVILGLLSTRLIIKLQVPQFLIYTSYIFIIIFALMIPLALKGSRIGLITNIILAGTVMIANTAIRDHMAILFSPSFMYATLILLVGAYVLQPILLITSLLALRARRCL